MTIIDGTTYDLRAYQPEVLTGCEPWDDSPSMVLPSNMRFSHLHEQPSLSMLIDDGMALCYPKYLATLLQMFT